MKTVNTNVRYAGLDLKNPIVVSSSGLTDSLHKIEILENSGAAAVVLKSIFEEQIMMDMPSISANNEIRGEKNNNSIDQFLSTNHLEKYISFISDCKKSVSIPIIASINCHTVRDWTKFAKNLENAGADAIELNVMLINTEREYKYGKVEQTNIEILKQVKKQVKIPVIMKIGREFTNLISLLNKFESNKASGIVMFNKNYSNEVDHEGVNLIPGAKLSDNGLFNQNLRWLTIASSILPSLDIAFSGAVYNGENIVKAILAGAKVTQICSTIYKNGPDFIPHMLAYLTDWMQMHNYETIDQFRGILNSPIIEDENLYQRIQFMKHFSNYEKETTKSDKELL